MEDLKLLLVGAVFGGLALFIIWFLYIREVRKSAKLESEKERMENEEAVREIISERLKQIETRRANTSTDQRLRERKYRD
jgi:flagellar biosynthesis/type III secretory pathway M-ring protein FliF/YscJ